MDSVCKTCKSTEFALENCERICINCGDVQEDLPNDQGNLCMIPDEEAVVDNFRVKKYETNERLTSRIRNETNTNDAKRQICREKLLDEVRRIVRQLVKHPSAVDETMELVTSTLKAYKGRLISSKKYGLVGACVYYLSAKHQLGISLADICKVLGIKMKVMSVSLKQVRDLCPDYEYERPNIKDLVRRHVDNIAAIRLDLASLEAACPAETRFDVKLEKRDPAPLIDNKDKVVLQDRVMLLIDLFEAMHPYNQPTPQSLTTAVIYHAWRSLDTFKMIAVNLNSNIQGIHNDLKPSSLKLEPESDEQRINRQAMMVKHSLSYEKFCLLCNLKYSSSGHKIVSKLQASMLMLGKYLGDVNKINLPTFLKDIIVNSPHLIQEHMRTEQNTARAKTIH